MPTPITAPTPCEAIFWKGALAGVPRVLSGVSKVMRMMDWEAGGGEAHEGLLGNLQSKDADEELIEGLVRFGAVGADEVRPTDDVLIVIAPQSMVGAPIYEALSAMADAAEAQGSAIVLLNPLLADVPSSGGVMVSRVGFERLGQPPLQRPTANVGTDPTSFRACAAAPIALPSPRPSAKFITSG